MKKHLAKSLVLASLLFWGACSNEFEHKGDSLDKSINYYTLVVNATKSNGEITRGLSLDGTTLNQKWDDGENVTILKKDGINWTEIGTLTASASSTENTILSGIVNSKLNVNDELHLLFPRTTWDYTGQNGILHDASSETTIEKKYDYAKAIVYVTAIEGNNVTVKRKDDLGNYHDGAIFNKEQAITKFTFSVPVKSFTIKSTYKSIVQYYTLDPIGGLGFHATNGDLTVTASTDQTVFYVAIRNNSEYKDYYSFSATDASNNHYAGVKSAKLVNGKFYTTDVTLFPVGIHNDHEYVDLGLPSGTKWATMNVEAGSIVGNGGFYAWGETTAKDTYAWDNYSFGNSSSCTDLGDISGSSIYDVARLKWGGSWRMPTLSEYEEIKTNCTWTWTTICGVAGDLVTGINGNSIFLPATGFKRWGVWEDKGKIGFYWLTTGMPTSDHTTAFDFYFNKDFYGGAPNGGSQHRYVGYVVRPVTE